MKRIYRPNKPYTTFSCIFACLGIHLHAVERPGCLTLGRVVGALGHHYIFTPRPKSSNAISWKSTSSPDLHRSLGPGAALAKAFPFALGFALGAIAPIPTSVVVPTKPMLGPFAASRPAMWTVATRPGSTTLVPASVRRRWMVGLGGVVEGLVMPPWIHLGWLPFASSFLSLSSWVPAMSFASSFSSV